MRSSAFRATLLLVGTLALAGGARADWGALNLPDGVTEISRTVKDLHMLIFWICVAIGVVVFGAMIVSMVLHRKSRGAEASDFHESTAVEVAWTVVPLLILVAMAVPAARVLIQMEDFEGSEMSIKVTGYQWRWQYEYLDEGISFYSALDADQNVARQRGADVDLEQFGDAYLRDVDNELVVPIDTKIRFLHTAADVIHSWWVQDFSVKKDSIPGFINENWAKIDEPGVYRGKCAELCGRGHGFMPIVVRAVTKEEYAAWVEERKADMVAEAEAAEKPWTHEALVDAGEKVYGHSCASCHQAEGQGIPGMFPPLAGSEVATGDVETHIETVMDGVEGSAMSAFRDRLDDVEIAAVLTYQRNAFGNVTGDTVQPADVRAWRGGEPLSGATRQSRLDITDEEFDIEGTIAR